MSEGNELVEGLRIFEEEDRGVELASRRTWGGQEADARPHHARALARHLPLPPV